MKKQNGPKRGVLHERCAVCGKREKKGCRLERENRFGRRFKDEKKVKDHFGDGVVFERCIWADLTSALESKYMHLSASFCIFHGYLCLRRGSDSVPHFDAWP